MKPTASPRVVIVGAGPAGVRAAEQLVAAGLRPVVIDEAPRAGGQIYRQPPPTLNRTARALYGFEAGKALALHARFEQLLPQLDHRPDTLVWHLEQRTLHLLGPRGLAEQPWEALILATGATDRVLPFPGWTLPGITSLGGAQVALKAQGCLVGPRVVMAGSGPLLYLVAWQYASQGAQVLAVLDAAPAGTARQVLGGLLARPGVAAKGAFYLADLRRRGVPVHAGVSGLRAQGHERIESIEWQSQGATHALACDALAVGHGLRSETQLADLAGCAFAFDPTEEAWLPVRDAAGRSSVPGVYLAGDGAAITGADAAELGGARAALAVLQDLAREAPGWQAPAAQLERQMAPHQRFRKAMAALNTPPANWATELPDETLVCRCEEVSAGDLRRCAAQTGALELNRLKAFSRIGMGRCQGRMCGAAAARLLAEATRQPLSAVGRLRAQPPIKPVPVEAFGDAEARPAPQDERDD